MQNRGEPDEIVVYRFQHKQAVSYARGLNMLAVNLSDEGIIDFYLGVSQG